jgi:RHS repeat-associated protein
MEKTINGTATMLTGLNIDEFFQRTDSSGSSDLLTDALGSTLELTDSTGTMQTTYSYDPFGATSINYFQSSNPFQFTGRENDWPNLYPALYYYRARYYSPLFQKFISQDPIDQALRVNGPRMVFSHWGLVAEPLLFNPQELGLYVYALNDPVAFIDPRGLYTCQGNWVPIGWEEIWEPPHNCECFWSCVSCEGSADLYAAPPATPGNLITTTSGDVVCFCLPPPGTQTGCGCRTGG